MMRRQEGLVRIAVAILSVLACAACGGTIYTDADTTVVAPKPLQREFTLPICAEALREAGVRGAWTAVLVRADGSVRDVQVQAGLGADGIARREYRKAVRVAGCDPEVERAIRQLRFTPAQKDGRPVAYRMQVGVALDFTRSD
jgi:hypothetical protein